MDSSVRRNVPLVVIEEHHEAFYVWDCAVQHAWITRSGNTLLHADSHSDMSLPRLRRPLRSTNDLGDSLEFVYRELDISSFIWPAVYMGLFNRVLWLKPQHRRSAGGWRRIVIRSKNPQNTEFELSFAGETSPCTPGAQTICFCPLTPQEYVATDQPIILDIDLDYFCCNDYPRPFFRQIEITRESFDEFNTNPYHVLRMSPGLKVSSISHADRYYLNVYDYCPDQPALQSNDELSHARDNFFQFLGRCSVLPLLIVVCRSVYSGYTPASVADDLQRLVLKDLAELYPLTLMRFDEIATFHHERADILAQRELTPVVEGGKMG